MAQTPTGRSIRGTIYDSLSDAPLSHASVSLVSRSDSNAAPRTVQADSAGRYRIAGVAPGVYLIGFQAPLLDSLGISSPTRVLRLSADGPASVIVTLAVPSARAVHDAFCPKRPVNDSTSAFIGHLEDASTRGVVAGGEINTTWLRITRRDKKVDLVPQKSVAHTTQDGSFAICDLPPNSMVAMHAVRGADTSSTVYFPTPAARGLIRREVYLPDHAAPRDGIVAGRVVTAQGGLPVKGAEVRLEANGARTTSADSGSFTLTHVPYGTSNLSVRAIGFVPQQVVLDVVGGAPTTVTLQLLSTANVLDTVRIRAARTIADDNGWSERQKAGIGRFFDENAINRMQPFETADIVRHVAGARIVPSGFDARILMRGMMGGYTCAPEYFLDGRRLYGIETTTDLEIAAPPEELAAVEVYSDHATVPGQFDGGIACGAIVMWTLPADLWGHGGH